MYIFKKFLAKIIYLFFLFFNAITKKRDWILIYSNLDFRDNGKALFDYLVNNEYNTNFRIYVATNKKYREKVNLANVKFVSLISALFIYTRSKYVFYTFGKLPIKPSKKQIVMHMWHGMPLKKIGNLERKGWISDCYFTHVLATSELFAPIMMEAFNCNEVYLGGMPRNDELFNFKDYGLKQPDEKLIAWLPTYRVSNIIKSQDSDFSDSLQILKEEDYGIINSYLVRNKVKLFIKFHPLQAEYLHNFNFSNLIVMNQKEFAERGFSVNSLLAQSDALISDYSSVYMDYLLLDRPIAFSILDIESYSKNRGFVFDNPQDYMPGLVIRNVDELKAFINNVVNGIDAYKMERARVNNILNKEQNGNFCKTLIDFCGINKEV